jgi:hypothetical protein
VGGSAREDYRRIPLCLDYGEILQRCTKIIDSGDNAGAKCRVLRSSRSMSTWQKRLSALIQIGMDVFILGYPFGAKPPGFPVWKRGSIASEPDLARPNTDYLLVDTASRPGMSGAPVIRRSWRNHLVEGDAMSMDSRPATKFIGVYSGRLHINDSDDAQIGMVWHPSFIDEIIAGGKLDDE